MFLIFGYANLSIATVEGMLSKSIGKFMQRKFETAVNCVLRIESELYKVLAGYTRGEKNALNVNVSDWTKLIEDWERNTTTSKNPFVGTVIRA